MPRAPSVKQEEGVTGRRASTRANRGIKRQAYSPEPESPVVRRKTVRRIKKEETPPPSLPSPVKEEYRDDFQPRIIPDPMRSPEPPVFNSANPPTEPQIMFLKSLSSQLGRPVNFATLDKVSATKLISEMKAEADKASPKQKRYIRSLGGSHEDLDGLTKSQASEMIDKLKRRGGGRFFDVAALFGDCGCADHYDHGGGYDYDEFGGDEGEYEFQHY